WQRAARTDRIFGCGGETLRRDLTILDVEHSGDEHDLATEMPTEEFAIVAGAQIGQRERRNSFAAAIEIERDRIGHGRGNTISGNGHWRRTERARCKLNRHRRLRRAVDNEAKRNAP